jgi:hypothetical protein
MLVSRLHNFIFIKTQKTAGTTAEVVFANYCGPEDVVTPLGRKDELERSNGTPICRNFDVTPELEKAYIHALIAGPEYLDRRRKEMKFYAHMRAKEIKAALDRSFWKKAFKFTTERHPYEKVVSKAFFKLGADGEMDLFPDLLDNVVREEKYSNFEYYAIGKKVVVDAIARVENLEADLRRIAEKIGVSLPDQLPRMKGIYRRDSRPAREILSQEQKDHIYRVCKREFRLLGYER